MKKISKTTAKKVFNKAKSDRNKKITVRYPVTDDNSGDKIDIDILTQISISDIRSITKEVIFASFVDGNGYDVAYHYAHLSKCIIDYLTSIPCPVLEGKEDDNITDVNLCYDIVFGEHGLVNDDRVSDLIDTLNGYVEAELETNKENHTSTGKLCAKILDLYEISKRVISDIGENPATLLNMLENVFGSEDAVSDLVNSVVDSAEEKTNVSMMKR